ncbi:Leucine aminopeptidase 1 [Mortierella sp. AM989]|nr:Leucine aminopeptidase 1 [Mortierella sp. AM989]
MVRLKSFAFLSLIAAISALAVPSWWEQLSFGNSKKYLLPSSMGDDELRLVQTSEGKAPFWTTERQRLEFIRTNIHFMDITDHQDLGDNATHSLLNSHALPRTLSKQKEFSKYVSDLSMAYMEVVLTDFVKFHNRYYKSEHGLEAAQWLYKKISDLIEESDAKADISLRKFKHKWDQFSIIARFEGRDEKLSNEPIIVAAHLDSINAWVPLLGRAPGADDDGSGTVLILDVFRVLIKKGFQPERPVEFHWYSAEEAGLLGSQDVAHSYKKKGVDVYAMNQAYQEMFGLVVDYVDSELTGLIKLYANEYTDIPIHETKCGYACSDHASWTKAGYRAAFATEGDFYDQCPYIHGLDDDLTHVDFEHMLQFAKLNLAFIVELANFKSIHA